MANVTLLMTRPRVAAERFIQALPATLKHRVSVCYSPLLEILPVNAEIDLTRVKGVIFTSVNGVSSTLGLTPPCGLVAYCVGKATADAASQAGWSAKMMGETARELIDTMLASRAVGPLLHLSGQHVRGDIAGELTNAGCLVRRLVVYDQKLLELTESAQVLIHEGGRIIAPMFSARTARHFFEQCPQDARLHVIALSPAVAKPLSNMPNLTVTLCNRPDTDNMKREVENVLNLLCRVESAGGAQ